MNFGGCTLGGTEYDKGKCQAQQADRETRREDDQRHKQDQQVAQGEVLKHDLVSLLLYRHCETFVTVGKLSSSEGWRCRRTVGLACRRGPLSVLQGYFDRLLKGDGLSVLFGRHEFPLFRSFE